VVEYRTSRGSTYAVGSIQLIHDGTTSYINVIESDQNADTGVTFTSDINAGNMRLLYTTTSTGSSASFLYFTKTFVV
jgi:hypothetical protein